MNRTTFAALLLALTLPTAAKPTDEAPLKPRLVD